MTGKTVTGKTAKATAAQVTGKKAKVPVAQVTGKKAKVPVTPQATRPRQVWMAKEAAEAQPPIEKAPQDTYSRTLLLQVMKKSALEEPRLSTPSTSLGSSPAITVASDPEDLAACFPLAEAPEMGFEALEAKPPPISLAASLAACDEAEAPGLGFEPLEATPPPSGAGAGRTMCAEAPAFVPQWVLPLNPLRGAVPLASAAEHCAALLAAERAARACAKPAPSRGKVAEAAKQIEFYFSVSNLCHDHYLRSLMDGEGWVSLKALVSFPKLRALSVDVPAVALALSHSSTMEVSEDSRSVRIRNEALRLTFPKEAAKK